MIKTLLSLLCIVSILFFVRPESIVHTSQLALRNVAVVDPGSGLIRNGLTVLIEGNRIVDVGPLAKVQIPRAARVIDASNKFVVPGLWDMHVHLFGKDYLKLFTANGVTGVRIMWGFPVFAEWRKQIEQGELIGPRLIIGSPIIDGPKPIWQGSISVASEVEGRQAVVKVKRDGADFVKVYSKLPRAAYFAIADEAKKQGIPFVGHVPESVSVREASMAGQRSIEHLTGFLAACSSREAELQEARRKAYADLPDGQSLPKLENLRPITRMMVDTFDANKAAALFAVLKANDTWQCPTLTVLRSTAFMNDPDFRNDTRLKYLPTQTTALWDPAKDFRFKDRTVEDIQLARIVFERQEMMVGQLNKAEVPLLAGTDTPNPFCFPGFSLHDELVLLVQAGLSPLEALRSATINPARFLGMDKELGTIEPDKLADLVILDANPLQDIKNTQKIHAVIMNGRLLNRKQLDRLLEETESTASR